VLFPTIEFAIFFTIVLALSWALMPRFELWKLFIIVASYVFYAAANPKFCLLLAGITIGNQLAAVALGRTGDERKRRWIVAGMPILGMIDSACRPWLIERSARSGRREGHRVRGSDAGALRFCEPAAELLERVCGHVRFEEDARALGHAGSLLTRPTVSVHLP